MEIVWYLEFIARFSLNLGAASVLMFGLYHRRHQNRDTAVSALLLNVFVFAVLTVLADVQFSLAAGFGLFAILALFTLRSEQLSRVDIAYFLLFAINAIDRGLMVIIILAMLASVYVLDHPKLSRPLRSTRIKLDMDRSFDVGDDAAVVEAVGRQTGLKAQRVQLVRVCGITETVELQVEY
jgi:uncharacterized membrane protein YqjE